MASAHGWSGPTFWSLVEDAGRGRSRRGRRRRRPRSVADRSQLRDAAEASRRAWSSGACGRAPSSSWQLPTTLEALVLLVALARLGAVQNPLIPILREREVGFITSQVGTDAADRADRRWRGLRPRRAGRELAARSGFERARSSTSTPSRRDRQRRCASPEGDPAHARRRPHLRPDRRCAGSTTRRARPPTRRASATPTAR